MARKLFYSSLRFKLFAVAFFAIVAIYIILSYTNSTKFNPPEITLELTKVQTTIEKVLQNIGYNETVAVADVEGNIMSAFEQVI